MLRSSQPPFVIRDAIPADIPTLAQLHVRTFNETHAFVPGHAPSFELRERQWQEAFSGADQTWFCFVVQNERSELLGFAKGNPYLEPEPVGFQGELNKIYVLRKFHRQGLGSRLLGHVVRRFLSRGITSMLLFGEATSPSNGFYERMGAEKLYAPRGEFHGGYGWRDLRLFAARFAADWITS